MPWCPECKTEYRGDKIKICPRCQSKLLAENLEELMQTGDLAAKRFLFGLSTAVIFVGLLYLIPLLEAARPNQASTPALALIALSIFGFASGIRDWKQTAIIVAATLAFLFLVSGGGSTIAVICALYFYAVPSIMSAYLGRKWKLRGSSYLVLWLIFNILLIISPFTEDYFRALFWSFTY